MLAYVEEQMAMAVNQSMNSPIIVDSSLSSESKDDVLECGHTKRSG
jgi:hypothetical protein